MRPTTGGDDPLRGLGAEEGRKGRKPVSVVTELPPQVVQVAITVNGPEGIHQAPTNAIKPLPTLPIRGQHVTIPGALTTATEELPTHWWTCPDTLIAHRPLALRVRTFRETSRSRGPTTPADLQSISVGTLVFCQAPTRMLTKMLGMSTLSLLELVATRAPRRGGGDGSRPARRCAGAECHLGP